MDRVEMKNRFAFVYMPSRREAEDAIRGLNRAFGGESAMRLRVRPAAREKSTGCGGVGANQPSESRVGRGKALPCLRAAAARDNTADCGGRRVRGGCCHEPGRSG